ncbi:hypothetical protein BDP81DRAFT_109989 [Colletotrichum phormii]|uniref:Uncharacterized protein n=1 Tax=Colletotrichum phormii TaxID=359342 RepID=A0AAJ0ECA6_9PEZI|nr:uncharacterized protein BDP81DRAFT_109989 [Colletotrichum phormii]KAK1624513.1 hypothetical protein BDP81DRAFT_109989 [Colletotrichum phormii]
MCGPRMLPTGLIPIIKLDTECWMPASCRLGAVSSSDKTLTKRMANIRRWAREKAVRSSKHGPYGLWTVDWMLLFLAPSVEQVTLPRSRERTGCLALVGWKRKAKNEREFSLTDMKKTASSPLGSNIKGVWQGEGGSSAAKDVSEHSRVHSKEGRGVYPGLISSLDPSL